METPTLNMDLFFTRPAKASEGPAAYQLRANRVWHPEDQGLSDFLFDLAEVIRHMQAIIG
jgi:hypothetical protein